MTTKYDFSSKKLHNNMPLSKGMKIAPMVIEDRATSISMGMDPQNMKTFKSKVHNKMPYLVSFIEVSEDQFEDYMKKSYRDQIKDIPRSFVLRTTLPAIVSLKRLCSLPMIFDRIMNWARG